MTINAGRLYTDLERATLRRMYLDGAKYWEIGEALGRSVKSVEDQRHKMGLEAREKPVPTRSDSRSKDAGPITFTAQELNREAQWTRACTLHLIDLLREYGGGEVGVAKREYKSRNELDIPPGAERSIIIPTGLNISACSSPAGWMA